MLRPRVQTDPVFGTGAASLYLPAFHKLVARVGLAPTPPGLSQYIGTTLTLPGNGAAGRILTCMVPFRRRMPHIIRPRQRLKLAAQAGVAPAPFRLTNGRTTVIPLSSEMVSATGIAPVVPRFQAGHVAATPRAMALPMGLAPTLFPQTTGCFSIQLQERKWPARSKPLTKAGGKRW